MAHDSRAVSWHTFLKEQYQASCREEASRLDSLLHQRAQLGAHAEVSLPASPVAKLFQLTTFKVVLLCVSVLTTVFVILDEVSGYYQVQSGVEFRCTALEFRNTTASGVSFVAANASIRTQCGIVAPNKQAISGTSITVGYDEPVDMHGWRYDLTSDTDHAPVEWLVEVKQTAQQEFQNMKRFAAQCSWWRVPHGQRARKTIDLSFGRDPLHRRLSFAFTSAGAALVLVLCVAKRLLLARRVAVFALLTIAAVCSVAAVKAAAGAQDDQMIRWTKTALLPALIAPFIAFKRLEMVLGYACIGIGMSCFALEVVSAAGALGDCGDVGHSLSNPSIYSALLLLTSGVMLALASWKHHSALREQLEQYHLRLEATWAELLANDRCVEALRPLVAEVVARGGLLPKPLQGYVALPAEDSSCHAKTLPSKKRAHHGAHRGASAHAAAHVRSVHSLDQLYALAAGCSVLLRDKVKHLALRSNGMVPTEPPKATSRDPARAYALLAETEGIDSGEREVYWTPLKPEERAMEKVLSRYGGEVARLSDVCRESLAFASCEDLCQCLRELFSDPDVKVLRVKNSMDARARAVSGFRAVAVTLRFVCAAAESLGLTHHACELLLLHVAIAASLTQEQHDAFLEARYLQLLPETAPPWRSWFGRLHDAAPAPGSQSSTPRHPGQEQPPGTLQARALTSKPPSSSSLPSPPSPQPSVLVAGHHAPPSDVPASSLPPRPASPQEVTLQPAELEGLRGRRPSGEEGGGEGGGGEQGGMAGAEPVGAGRSTADSAEHSESGVRREASAEAVAWEAALEAAAGEGGVPARVLLQQFRVRAALQGPAEVYERAPTLHESVDRCRGLSAFSTSFPIAAAMRKTFFPLFWLLVAVATGYALPSWPGELAGTASAKVVSLVVLQLREASPPPTAAVIEALQLHHAGCAVAGNSRLTVAADFLNYTLEFDAVVDFDEVVFRTPARSSAAFDPVAFAVQASLDGEEWWQAAASRKVLLLSGGLRFDHAPADIPEQRRRLVSVSLWTLWYVNERLADLIIVAYALLITVLSLLRKYEWGRPVTIALPVLIGIQAAVSAVARTVLGYFFVVPLDYGKALISFLSAYWLFWYEGQVLEVVLANAVVYSSNHYLERLFDPGIDSVLSRHPFSSIAVALGCLALMAFKWRYQHLTFRKIRDDVALYDAEWKAVLADPAQLDGCRRIAAALERVSGQQRPRQCFSRPGEGLEMFERVQSALSRTVSLRVLSATGAAEVEQQRPVATLGLVYRQAAGVYHLAQLQLRKWCKAAPAGAMVPYKLEDGTVGLARVVGLEGTAGGEAGGGDGWEEAAQKLPPLKCVNRASEKLMRAYAADASRLLDVCRFGLVTDTAGQLADVVQLIRVDTEVEVVSCKNRLREGYNAKQTAGFRDVHLNLVMRTAEAARLGLSGHVWELQLMLTPFCKLRSEGGHARYVKYRDSRAE